MRHEAERDVRPPPAVSRQERKRRRGMTFAQTEAVRSTLSLALAGKFWAGCHSRGAVHDARSPSSRTPCCCPQQGPALGGRQGPFQTANNAPAERDVTPSWTWPSGGRRGGACAQGGGLWRYYSQRHTSIFTRVLPKITLYYVLCLAVLKGQWLWFTGALSAVQ